MKRLLWVMKSAVTGGVLYYIFTITPLREIVESVASAQPMYLMLGLSVALFMRYPAACRMKLLMKKQGMSLSMRQIFEINLISSFYGLLLPGYLAGGAVRWYKFRRAENKSLEVLASMAFDRLSDTTVLAILGLWFWMLDSESQSRAGFCLMAVLAGLLLIHVVVFNKHALALLKRYLDGNGLSRLPVRLRSKISGVVDVIGRCDGLSGSLLMNVGVLSLARHFLGVLSIYVFAVALGMNVSLVNIGWIRSLVLMITLLPISISGLGVREATLIVLLQPYGVPAPEAVALSFLLLSRLLFGAAIGGLLEAKAWFVGPSASELEELRS